MTSLSNKIAIVTGSTSGIGLAIAKLLSNNGVNIVINSVSSVEKGEKISSELPNSFYCQADISKESDCENLIYKTIEKFSRLDFLINNAGAVGRLPSNNLSEISNEIFAQTLNANVVGTWSLIRSAIPYLKKSQDGVIINITSVAGINPGSITNALPYAVSKAALNYLTKLLAKELGPEIRVNAIAPGLITTPRTENFDAAIEKFKTRTPLKRVGDTNDIAELALAIIKSNYINGEIIVADGGFSVC